MFPPVERVTCIRWPMPPRDYSPQAVAQRWKDALPAYLAFRSQEIQNAAKAAKDKQ